MSVESQQKPYDLATVKKFASNLGVQTEGLTPSQISQRLAEVAYQRRAKELGTPAEIAEDSNLSARFLLDRTDPIIQPGRQNIHAIMSYLERTQVRVLKLTDFHFFSEASVSTGEIRSLAGNPDLLQSEREFEDKLGSTLKEIRELLHHQDGEGLDRAEQVLAQEKTDLVRQTLFAIYVLGAFRFKKRFFSHPDWYWPITWSDDPIGFEDARKTGEILKSWQNPDNQKTTYQAVCDLSKMYHMWYDAKIQWLTCTSRKLKYLRPNFRQRFTNWGQRARGIK
jgi:hypothetical protein